MTGRFGLACFFAFCACLAGPEASAAEAYLVQGILDAELYSSDTASPLLTRNDGDTATLGRLQLWAAFQLSPSWQFYARGEVESDNFEGYAETNSDLDQVAFRYTHQASPWFYVEAGKILSPLVAYSDRRLSSQNPLIGQPYLYTRGYPWGAKLAGAVGWFDYQLAWIDPSDNDSEYQAIEPDSAFRAALGAGVTPFTGLRLGLSWTEGPYLAGDIADKLPQGSHWRDYDQRVLGLDLQFSRGYLEFNGQWFRTENELPYGDSDPDSSSYYLELKYTWSPRLFSAVRYQNVEASYVDYSYYRRWYAETENFSLLEIGLGYRFSRDLLFKAVYETDHRENSTYAYGASARGHALGLQLSWSFDVVSLLSDAP